MVLIYSNKTSPRLQYIAAFIFKELIKVPYAITRHEESFKSFDGIKINYSEENIHDDELHIPLSGLLFQDDVREQNVTTKEFNGYKVFFAPEFEKQTAKEYSFDIFGASFYLLTRYEEYLPHSKDKYGRYAPENSLAYKETFLHLPLINIWVNDFAEWLKKFADVQFELPQFTFIPTYDIDMAFSFLHKGLVRNAGGFLRSIATLNFRSAAERLNVLLKNKKDPFDIYEWLDELHKAYDLDPVYFFLVAEKNEAYDKNILPGTKEMKDVITQHSEKYSIGLHPSWQSNDNVALLKSEKQTLENISQKEIQKSRQHYIRLTFPDTFRNLIDADIKDDYSLGYTSINGFRASVASSFFWYDLEKDEQTKLRIHPFCYMDNTVIHYKKLSPQQAYDEMMEYYNACKKVNGTFIPVLHNNLLNEKWKEVYESFLKNIS